MNENDIKEVVRHTVPEVLSAYGVDVTDPQEAQADMAFLRRRRNFAEKFTTRARLTVITVLASSSGAGLGYFLKQTLNLGN